MEVVEFKQEIDLGARRARVDAANRQKARDLLAAGIMKGVGEWINGMIQREYVIKQVKAGLVDNPEIHDVARTFHERAMRGGYRLYQHMAIDRRDGDEAKVYFAYSLPNGNALNAVVRVSTALVDGETMADLATDKLCADIEAEIAQMIDRQTRRGGRLQ